MLECTYAQVQCEAAHWRLEKVLRKSFQASDATLDMEVANAEDANCLHN